MGLILLTVAAVVLVAVGVWSLRTTRTAACEDCKAFDLSKGQDVIEQHPVFKQASLILPPAVMGAPVNEEGIPEDSGVPNDCAWTEFGVCSVHNELRWARDKCPKFKRKSVLEARAARRELVQLRKGRPPQVGL